MEIITKNTTGVSDAMVRGHLSLLKPYAHLLQGVLGEAVYDTPESALHTPFDEEMLNEVLEKVIPHRTKVKTVLLVGIGGSDLGTRAIYDALYGHRDQYTRSQTPRLLSFGTVEPRALAVMRDVLKEHTAPEEVALIVVSKSGNTTETIANANILFGLLKETFSEEAAARQTFVITNENSSLAQTAKNSSFGLFVIPDLVGGRYSVFSAVGLLPLALLGADIRALCEGAQKGARASAPAEGISSASLLASLLFDSYLRGNRIHELFMWNPELETLGKWYRQLLAESIGKERDDTTRVGITPTVALGSTDLHSLGQLVFGGPPSRFTTFVATPSTWDNTQTVAADSPFTLEMLQGKETGTVMHAIYEGVRNTYHSHHIPFVRMELTAISEREIGAFMAVQMATVMYLARLFEVNAFDQPAVEAYKSETRRLLTS